MHSTLKSSKICLGNSFRAGFWMVCLLALGSCLFGQAKPGNCLLFAGSYTDGRPGNGIQVFRFDGSSGSLHRLGKVGQIVNPSYLTVSPSGKYVFACTETKLPGEGGVTSFAVDSVHGRLLRRSRQPSGGANPVHVSVHPDEGWITAANYAEGTISVFPAATDGVIGPIRQRIAFTDSSVFKSRQEKSHPHAAVFSPDGRFLFVPDLGADKIRVFGFAATASMPLTELPDLTVRTFPASGPRHLAFHPNGRFAYNIEELSGFVTVYAYADGRLDSLQRLFAYSKQQPHYGSADIHLSPDGRFLYASNRWENENTLAIFRVDAVSGLLSFVAHQGTLGDHPRNFCISADGGHLVVANQVTGNLVVFGRDAATGLLVPVGRETRMRNVSSLWMRGYGGGME